MTTIRHREMINPELLDESGLRKKPFEHEKLTKDERKVVVKFTDQSYLRVVLVNGETVRLRVLRENIYRWFPDLRPQRTGPTFRTARAPATLSSKRVIPDEAYKKQVRFLADCFMLKSGYLIDKRIRGRISTKSVRDDFECMEMLADLAIILEKITISESSEIFNEMFPRAKTHDISYLWLRTAFLSRNCEDKYLMNSIRRTLLPQDRMEFDDEARRLQLSTYIDYRNYKFNRTMLLDDQRGLANKIEQLTEITRGRLLLEQIKTIQSYEDRVLIRMQYLLIEKVLKPLQDK